MKNGILTSVFIVVFCCFSQEEKVVFFSQKDTILTYDILLDVRPEDTKVIQHKTFNEQNVKSQLDSINKLTPLDITYTKEIGQYIKFYLFKRPEQVSRLLTMAEYYFPIFEAYLDKHNLPLELKYITCFEL